MPLDIQSCLLVQERQKAKRPGDYMLYNYGKVHSVPRTSGMTDYQVNFIASNPAKSLITISIAADDITIVEHKSFGRIVEAYIESFESLSATGVLNIIIQNTGRYTAVLNVRMLMISLIDCLYISFLRRCLCYIVPLVSIRFRRSP